MSFMFWGFALAMLIAAVGFIAVPLKTGRSLLASPLALIVAIVPLLAMALYAWLGSPNAMEVAPAKHQPGMPAAGQGSDRSLGSVASMVDGLRARLENEPDDADGWILLARSYQHLDQPAEALDAYEHARALGKTDINLEASLLGSSLAGQAATAPAGVALRGRVSLSPAAAAKVQAGDTLFIFAKESREHRMPVVALRRSVDDLPMEFALTDKEVMVPGSKLSDYDQLVVTAKISRSGNASDSSLALEAWSDPVSPTNSKHLDLIIGDDSE